MKKYSLYIITGSVLFVSACGNKEGTQNRGPITLGDSSVIVTEKDSQYLKDEVMDLIPAQRLHSDSTVATVAKKEKEVVPAEAAASQEQTVSGYAINFGASKIVLSGLQVKDAGRQNPERQDGLTYTLRSGTPGAGKIYVYGTKNVTIKQRYQSRLMLKSNLGSVDLRDLGLYSSGWNTVAAVPSGDASSFSLNGLNSVSYSQINNNKIKNAADRELRKRRTNSRTIQSWMKEIRRIRNAGDEPCEIILDNIQWQISGTDAKGKAFQKNIRLDV